MIYIIDNLNDDEYDVTWGGKRSRYLYNYILEIPDSNTDDSDQTESVLSIQSKSTSNIFLNRLYIDIDFIKLNFFLYMFILRNSNF